MADNYFSLTQTKRYYHLIAFKYESEYSTQSFFKDCGVKKSDVQRSYDDDGLVIEHGKIVSSMRFYNGNQDYSINGNGLAPFQYDIVAIDMQKLKIIAFGFPFKLLARTITDNLLNNKKLLLRGRFYKPLLNKLIGLYNTSKITNKNFSTIFSGVELQLSGDPNLRAVSLYGDAPLESNVYKKIFLELIDNEECKLERCSMRFETDSDIQRNLPKTRSNVHLDLFGNYKLYIHQSGKNIFTIPIVFSLLEKYKCLELTSTNPIIRLHDE